MTDKEFLMDILEMEKNMAVDMTYALNEASNDDLYKELFKIFTKISANAKDLFTLAYNEGYYPLENEEKNKITVALDTLKKELKK